MNMRNNILVPLFLFFTSQMYAQYPSEISFEINQQIFAVKVGFTTKQIPVVTFFKDTISIKTDTLILGETRLYFRAFNKDTLINISLIAFKKQYENCVYSNECNYDIGYNKLLSLDIYSMNDNRSCKLYEYNKKTNNFNSVNGLELIYKPILLSSNPNYFICNKTEDSNCEEFHFITTLYSIKKLKFSPIAEMIGYTQAGGPEIVELYKIDNKDENKKTMIDRQMSYHYGRCYECSPPPMAFIPSLQYWEEHYNDIETYRLGIHMQLIKSKTNR